ncbi:MAG: isoprenylcysteine carboxylmethyltransferase family protein [Candidatus Micrarchaeota archaeon]
MVNAAALAGKIVLYFFIGIAVTGLFLFVPAGTLDYWQAWLFLAVLFIPAFFVSTYFLKNDPEFLIRRLKFKEKQGQQKKIVSAVSVLFFIGFLIPGLDRRYGWSSVPFELSVLAFLVFLLGYFLNFLVFKENSYAGRTVEIFKGQKLVSTGLYSIVRHPMYSAQLLLYVSLPFALGSYWALIPFLAIPIALYYRILNEEKVLLAGLPGYAAYQKKVRYRLIPGVW